MKDHIKEKLMELSKNHPHIVQLVESKPHFTPKAVNVTPNALTTVISTSTAIDQAFIDTAVFPITVQGGTSQSPVVVTFIENLTLHTHDSYFIINSDHIIFDGENNEVHFDIPMDEFPVFYTGLFHNGTGSESESNHDAFDYICVKNIKLILDNSINSLLLLDITPFQECGWFASAYYGVTKTHNTFQNLFTNGDALSSGAILGNYSTANLCYCYGTGIIGFPLLQIILNQSLDGIGFAGGLVGAYCVNCNINNCFTAGRIGLLGGGISGFACDGLTITNCYALGNIFPLAGGICGAGTTNTTVTDSYSNQTLTEFSGSIYGFGCETCVADNIYTSSVYVDGLPRIYALQDSDTQVVLNSYTYYNSWSNATADLILQNKCWKVFTKIGCNSFPYLLTGFDKRNYEVNKKVVKSGCLKHSEPGLWENTNYMILSVNGKAHHDKIWINENTGVLTFDKIEYKKCEHKFDVKVLSYQIVGGNYFNYNISTFHLEVCKC